MATFNKDMLAKARASIKQAFVPMPGGQGEPVAGSSAMTAALPGAPQDPAAGGAPVDPATGMPMDPAAMGMPPGAPPMDPAMMGGAPAGAPPMDPAMAGGDPAAAGMPPMDPAMMDPAMGGGMPPMDGNITMPVSQLLQLIQTLLGQATGGGATDASGKPAEGGEAKPKKAGTSSKIDAIYQALASQGIIAPEAGAAPEGGAPTGAPQG